MIKLIAWILTVVVISAGIYCGIAAVLILTGKPKMSAPHPDRLAFDELPTD